MRGRKPQPDELKRAKGNPGKRALAAPLEASPVTLKAPAKLSAAALAVWRETATELERMNFLRPTDRNAFARYCETVAEYWRVSTSLRRLKSNTYETDTLHGRMLRIHPDFLVQDRLFKRLTDLEDRFGLSPAARQAIMLRLAQVQPQLPFGATAVPETKEPDGPIGILGASVH